MRKAVSSRPPKRATRRSGGTRSGKISSYPTALRFLQDRVDFERLRVMRYDGTLFKLDRMRALLDALGNPETQLKTVHIAGTLGKGSTVAMIAAMLRNCGYAVGQYTSPHLVEVRERITINGELITKPAFTELMRHVAKAAKTLPHEPTYFEIMTAMALKHFADQAVDLAVFETGLGGRLDSTNVLTPLVTLITRIDYDHQQVLGTTLTEIAAEKAGIMKPGVPCLSIKQPPEVEAVIRETAEAVGTTVLIIDKDIEFSSRFGTCEELGPHMRVCVMIDSYQYMHLPVPLAGEHQAQNCGLALATIATLHGCGFELPEMAVHAGLAQTSIAGRMELVWNQPRILIDGAHNPAAIEALMRSAGAFVPYDSMICVFGCCEDKDVDTMLDRLALGGDKVIFTRARSTPRAIDPEILHRKFSERTGKMSQIAATIPEALDLATRAVGRDDLICVTGSFYLVGEAKKYLTQLRRRQQQQQAAAVG